jgi:hypothetical protein
LPLFAFPETPAMMPPVDCTASEGTGRFDTDLDVPEPDSVCVVNVVLIAPVAIESFRRPAPVPTYFLVLCDRLS